MLRQLTAPRAPIHLNRSVPFAQGDQKQVTRFTMLDSDPRPIDRDLALVATGTDPRRMVFFWYRFMAKFGASAEARLRQRMQVHCLHAIGGSGNYEVHTRDGFLQYLKVIDQGWARHVRDYRRPLWGEVLSEEEYNGLRQELHDVVGFWVFDKDAFGEIPKQGAENELGYVNYKMIADVTSYRPGLIVFDISDGLK